MSADQPSSAAPTSSELNEARAVHELNASFCQPPPLPTTGAPSSPAVDSSARAANNKPLVVPLQPRAQGLSIKFSMPGFATVFIWTILATVASAWWFETYPCFPCHLSHVINQNPTYWVFLVGSTVTSMLFLGADFKGPGLSPLATPQFGFKFLACVCLGIAAVVPSGSGANESIHTAASVTCFIFFINYAFLEEWRSPQRNRKRIVAIVVGVLCLFSRIWIVLMALSNAPLKCIGQIARATPDWDVVSFEISSILSLYRNDALLLQKMAVLQYINICAVFYAVYASALHPTPAQLPEGKEKKA